MVATEPEEVLRVFAKDIESLLALRGIAPTPDDCVDSCRGTRETDVDGEARNECLEDVGSLLVDDWFSRTPNSFIVSLPSVGEGSAEEVFPPA